MDSSCARGIMKVQWDGHAQYRAGSCFAPWDAQYRGMDMTHVRLMPSWVGVSGDAHHPSTAPTVAMNRHHLPNKALNASSANGTCAGRGSVAASLTIEITCHIRTVDISCHIRTAETSCHIRTAEISCHTRTAEISCHIRTVEISCHIRAAEISCHIRTVEISCHIRTVAISWFWERVASGWRWMGSQGWDWPKRALRGGGGWDPRVGIGQRGPCLPHPMPFQRPSHRSRQPRRVLLKGRIRLQDRT